MEPARVLMLFPTKEAIREQLSRETIAGTVFFREGRTDDEASSWLCCNYPLTEL